MGYEVLKCGFLPEQDCLKERCPLRAWVEDKNFVSSSLSSSLGSHVPPCNGRIDAESETRGMCIFDIAAITIKRVVSGTEKLARVIKSMSRDELIQKGVEVWKKIR